MTVRAYDTLCAATCTSHLKRAVGAQRSPPLLSVRCYIGHDTAQRLMCSREEPEPSKPHRMRHPSDMTQFVKNYFPRQRLPKSHRTCPMHLCPMPSSASDVTLTPWLASERCLQCDAFLASVRCSVRCSYCCCLRLGFDIGHSSSASDALVFSVRCRQRAASLHSFIPCANVLAPKYFLYLCT
jgi:hypothetical protein